MELTKNEIKEFLKLPTGNFCDANDKMGAMDPGIKPVSPLFKMAGPAFTVECQPCDNLTIHKAIAAAQPGSILVVNARSYIKAGHFGEIMALACQQRGIAGLVLDGGCRDAAELEEMGFPVFCRGINPNGTVKASMGKLNTVIQCGGVVVKPGDIVLGDRDGVVVIPLEKAQAVLEKAQAISENENNVKKMLKQGKTTLEILGLR